MKKLKYLLLLLCLLSTFSCNTNKKEKPVVVSTIGMIHDVVQEIGGDTIEAIGLMGPGIDPHLYKASAGDIEKLNRADIIFYNGLHLEAKMIDIFKKIGHKKTTVAVTKSIPDQLLLADEDYKGFSDPHVWFDVSLWKIVANEITNSLIKTIPNQKETYLQNLKKYNQKLDELDQWVINEINQIPQERRRLITAHDAFRYFGKRYNITVIGLQGINTASEANTKDIQKLTNVIISNNVPTIFIESSVPVKQIEAVQAAVRAKGARVSIGTPLFTDAMGSEGTPEGSYIGMIKHNVKSIVFGLK